MLNKNTLALKLWELGYHIVPVDKEKRPLVKWKERLTLEKLEKTLEKAHGIAIVCGNIHPFGDKYTLVSIDVDNPTLLGFSTILGKLLKDTVYVLTGPRCPRCGNKHIEIIEEGRRFKCPNCDIEFDIEKTSRGFAILVFVENPLVDKYIGGTKRYKHIEFLVNNYQVIIGKHKTGVEYDLRNIDINRKDIGIAILDEKDIIELINEIEKYNKLKQEEKTKERKIEKTGLKVLKEEEINQIVNVLKDVYKQGVRQFIWVYLSGWGAKAGIDYTSIAKALYILYVTTKDTDSIRMRGSAIVYSYEKAGISVDKRRLAEILGEEPYGPEVIPQEEIKGISGLYEIFQSAGIGEEEISSRMEKLEKIFGIPPIIDLIFKRMRERKEREIDYDKFFEIVEVKNVQSLETKEYKIFIKTQNEGSSLFSLPYSLRKEIKLKTETPIKNRMTIIEDSNTARFESFEEIYDAIINYIKSRLYFDDERIYKVLTSFVVYSWFWDTTNVATFIEFFGDYGSGKTRALEVLNDLCYRSIMSGNISLAAVPRLCEEYHALLCIDEFTGDEETRREFINLLNSSYRRGMYYIRVVNNKLESFDTFGPKVFASSEDLAKSLQTRTITIKMFKKKVKPVEEQEALRLMLIDNLTRLRINYFSFPHQENINNIISVLVDNGFDSRSAEVSANLLYFTPKKYLNDVYSFLRDFYISREEEFSATLEARVMSIIEKLRQENSIKTEGKVLSFPVKVVVDAYINEEELQYSQGGTQPHIRFSLNTKIGKILTKLGFGRKHTKDGNIAFIYEEQYKKLKELYLKERTALEQEVKQEINIDNYLFETQIKDSFDLLLDYEKEQIQKTQ
jgi:predicted RNA-binding Zn-ribbon protein involved in translation (DUF1610 family)